MNAGLLTETIDILKPVEVGNAFGEKETVFAPKYHTRARVIFDSGNRESVNDEIFYLYNVSFQMRIYVPIDDTSLIQWDGKRYRVLSIQERREYSDKMIRTALVNE